jgi:hypothetical protein
MAGTSRFAADDAPKASRFPIRELPTATAASGDALWVLAVPSNVAYCGQTGKYMLDLRFTAFGTRLGHEVIASRQCAPSIPNGQFATNTAYFFIIPDQPRPGLPNWAS